MIIFFTKSMQTKSLVLEFNPISLNQNFTLTSIVEKKNHKINKNFIRKNLPILTALLRQQKGLFLAIFWQKSLQANPLIPYSHTLIPLDKCFGFFFIVEKGDQKKFIKFPELKFAYFVQVYTMGYTINSQQQNFLHIFSAQSEVREQEKKF